jgi:phosphotransferase system HPr (HPr) family protein
MEQEVRIENKLGLHLRAAALFIETANKFKSEVFLQNASRRVNAKSIMGLMTLAAAKGAVVKIIVEGEDAPAALASLAALVREKFHEKE